MEDILKRLEKYYHKYIRGTLNINQFIFNVFFAEIGGLMIDTNAIFGYTMFIGGINSCSKEKYIIKLKNGKILHKVKQLY
jgi:hypothetical protein